MDGKPLSTKTSDISTPASERKGGDDSSASQSARWQIYVTESLADSHHKTGLHFQTLNSCSFWIWIWFLCKLRTFWQFQDSYTEICLHTSAVFFGSHSKPLFKAGQVKHENVRCIYCICQLTLMNYSRCQKQNFFPLMDNIFKIYCEINNCRTMVGTQVFYPASVANLFRLYTVALTKKSHVRRKAWRGCKP